MSTNVSSAFMVIKQIYHIQVIRLHLNPENTLTGQPKDDIHREISAITAPVADLFSLSDRSSTAPLVEDPGCLLTRRCRLFKTLPSENFHQLSRHILQQAASSLDPATPEVDRIEGFYYKPLKAVTDKQAALCRRHFCVLAHSCFFDSVHIFW